MQQKINEIRPYRAINRRKSRQISIGNVLIGGDAPIAVQSMTNTPTTDIQGTILQVAKCVELGAELMRISVPDQESALALKKIIPKKKNRVFVKLSSFNNKVSGIKLLIY